MNHSLPKLAVRWIAGTCVALSAIALPWLWHGRPDIRMFTTVWYEGKVDDFVRNWKQLDLRMADAAGSGNVVLRFSGFDPDRPEHVQIVQQACWRGAYGLYPQRVLVAEPGTVINNARDVLAARFDPSIQWLQANNVRAVLYFTAVGETGFNVRGQAISAGGGR